VSSALVGAFTQRNRSEPSGRSTYTPSRALAVKYGSAESDYRFRGLLESSAFDIEVQGRDVHVSASQTEAVREIIPIGLVLKFILMNDGRGAMNEVYSYNLLAPFVEKTNLVVNLFPSRKRREKAGRLLHGAGSAIFEPFL
jgi:hypothetical protein